jgi:hypothetical protein
MWEFLRNKSVNCVLNFFAVLYSEECNFNLILHSREYNFRQILCFVKYNLYLCEKFQQYEATIYSVLSKTN